MLLYRLYKLLTYLIFPFLLPYLLFRIIKGKEDKIRFKEKLTIISATREKGKLIWFHAASVGELKSALPLITDLEKDNNILITTITVSSAKIFKQAKLKHSIHQYLPLDHPFLVNRFIKHWQPDLGILIDSEIWPNLIMTCVRSKIPLINLNARLSDRSYYLWSKLSSFAKLIFNNFSLIIASSKHDIAKIKNFTSKKILYFGNLKYTSSYTSFNKKEYGLVKRSLHSRKLWVASSTHKGEENIIINVHKRLIQEFKNLLLVIVPRHPPRGTEILNIAMRTGLTAKMRSEGKDLNSNVYIADTLGELGLWYRLASIVFVGKSLVHGGGHNILEAAALNSAIIVGPHTNNFKEIIKKFSKANALIEIKNEDELFNSVRNLLSNEKPLQQLINAALIEVKKNSKVLKNILSEIKSFL